MSESSGRKVSLGRMFITAVFVIGAFLAGYKVMEMQAASSADSAVDESNARNAQIAGVDRTPTNNLLDSRFTDNNKDMLADAPADPKQFIDPPTIKFSYLATDNPEKPMAAFKDLMDAISKETGKPVEYIAYASPEDNHIAFHRGDVQIVGFNTGLVPPAVCTSGFQPVAMMADATGGANYKMEILTAASSPVKDIKDIKGRQFTFTDMNSNSGYKAPLSVLSEAGLKFSFSYEPRFSQSYRQSLEGLKSGTYENVAVADDVLKREVAAGTIEEKDFRVVFTGQSSFPTAAIGFRNDLSPSLAAKIRQAILNFKWEGSSLAKVYNVEGRAKFVPIDYAKDYEDVRKIDDGLGIKYVSPAGEPALYQAPPPTTMPTSQAAN